MNTAVVETGLSAEVRPAASLLPGVRRVGHQLRSANVEHDSASGALDHYVLTRRGEDLLRRVAATLDEPDSGRAWAVTGPYGAGKSSFALLLGALLCRPVDSPGADGASLHERAVDIVRHHDPALAEEFAAHSARRPMLRAAVTARREPVLRTVLRALQSAAVDDKQLAASLDDLGSNETTTTAAVLDLITTTADRRPLLIMIDEFGKNLEHFAASGSADDADDLFFLQELAELAAGRRARPIYLLTFQHAAFVDYANRATTLQRREWSKIQGRFQDVSYYDDPADAAALIAAALSTEIDPTSQARLEQYGSEVADKWRSLGLHGLLPSQSATFEATYPVHPVSVAALPALCAVLGQHDRTLTGFISGDEPYTLARFLELGTSRSAKSAKSARAAKSAKAAGPEKTALATIRLAGVFDYFTNSVRSSALSGSGSTRWLEIESRIEAARHLLDLAPLSLEVLKSVGMLNLVSAGGALRASEAIVAFATADPDAVTDAWQGVVAEHLEDLVRRGYLTYRAHDDEFRVWAGTDIDIAARVSELRSRFETTDLAGLISQNFMANAVVAGRHSQETGILRYFSTIVASAGTGHSSGRAGFRAGGDIETGADGVLVMSLGGHGHLPQVDHQGPVLFGSTPDADDIRSAAADVLALAELLDAPDLDTVARAETRERLAIARARLSAVLGRAYDPQRPDVTWTLRLSSNAPEKEMVRHDSLSALVSKACDDAYPDSPHIRSEMLGRSQLTSQGAKARRELLTALVEHPAEPQGGLVGFGPEVAMYRGVAEHLGLHRETGWREPEEGSSAHAAFVAMRDAIHRADEISISSLQALLVQPPFGVKAGLFPLLVTAVLMLDHDIAIYEEGSFQPALQSDLLERIFKASDRVVLRHSPTGGGLRGDVMRLLTDGLGAGRRGNTRLRTPSLVAVAGSLLSTVREATTFGLRTRDLSAGATGVRAALKEARDPAELVFTALPAALGLEPIGAEARADTATAERYVADLIAAIDEIARLDERLTRRIAVALGDAVGMAETALTDAITGANNSAPSPLIGAARAYLAERAAVISASSAEPMVRALLQHATYTELADDDWVAQAALIVESEPPNNWRDENLTHFRSVAKQLVRAINRLYALHFDHAGAAGTADGSSARRVTLTRPDGREDHLVLTVPAADHDKLERVIDAALVAATDDLGPQAAALLLVGLANRVLDTNDAVPGAADGTADVHATAPEARRPLNHARSTS